MPRKKGRGEGRWRSLITGKYVSAYYGKRNPTKAYKVDEAKDGGEK